MLRFVLLFLLVSTAGAAESFDRPIPAPQSATAEIWFVLASLLLCLALYAVHRLVARR